MSEIPAAAVEAAARKRAEHYESEYDSTHLKWQDFAGEAREILDAALPHLRVQEAGVVDLAGALRETVDAARARRLGSADRRGGGIVSICPLHYVNHGLPHGHICPENSCGCLFRPGERLAANCPLHKDVATTLKAPAEWDGLVFPEYPIVDRAGWADANWDEPITLDDYLARRAVSGVRYEGKVLRGPSYAGSVRSSSTS